MSYWTFYFRIFKKISIGLNYFNTQNVWSFSKSEIYKKIWNSKINKFPEFHNLQLV